MNEINLQNIVQCEEPVVRVNIEETDRSKKILKENHNVNNDEVDNYRQSYAATRNVAEGMMDLALLTANANQLRFLMTYNSQSSTFFVSLGLIILSLVLQVAVGIALIFKHKNRKRSRMQRTNQFFVGGVYMITFVNILIAALTTTDKTQT